MPKGKSAKRVEKNEHLNQAQAKKVVILETVPGRVVTTNISAAGVLVGRGNVVRIMISNDPTYVAFGDSSIGAVDVNTTPAIRLNTANAVYMIVATADYIRASHVATRLEVVEEDDAFQLLDV